jgi:uncharacterized protein YgiM (DUF1202 family)
MAQYRKGLWLSLVVLLISLNLLGCNGKQKETAVHSTDLPDLSAQIRSYVTIENTKVRSGPGMQYRTISEIRRDAKVQVVGRDGDWVLIVSKKGNPPGYIERSSIEPTNSDLKQESPSAN